MPTKIIARTERAYQYLVNQTDNPNVIHDRNKTEKLSELLELFEYLLDESGEEQNPLPKWFDEPEE